MVGITRRRFIKAGLVPIIGVGAGYGSYELSAGLTSTEGIDAFVKEIIDVAKDVAGEVTGVAEQKLKESAANLRKEIGLTPEEVERRADYYGKLGILDRKEIDDLQQILDKAEYFVNESGLEERVIRLRDRFVEKALQVDQGIQSHYPKGLRDFNEWFAKKIKGEERGSQKALDMYQKRLSTLVEVYDANRDNRVAQSELLDDATFNFQKAQKVVLGHVDEYLADESLGKHERDYYKGLRQLAQEDPSGIALAEVIDSGGGYFRALAASQEMKTINARLKNLSEILHEQQTYLKQGISRVHSLRTVEEKGIEQVIKAANEFVTAYRASQEELREKGYKIDHELFPKLNAMEEYVLGMADRGRTLFNTSIGVAGGIVGAVISYFALPGKTTRRELLGIAKKYEALQVENRMLKAENDSLRAENNTYKTSSDSNTGDNGND